MALENGMNWPRIEMNSYVVKWGLRRCCREDAAAWAGSLIS